MTLEINDLMTVRQVAAAKGVLRGAVYSWMNRKLLVPATTLDGKPYFDRAEVEAFVKPKRGVRTKSPA